MNFLLLFLAVLSLLAALYLAIQVSFGLARMGWLREEPPAYGQLPKVSLIVAARNEERHVESAVRSLLRIDYEPLEITVVNDRSTDRTGEILRKLAAENPRLNLVEIEELPAGWLGKNHALHLGAAKSQGEWLLFSDADIWFEPLTLRRAIGFVDKHHIDHLALAPDTRMPNWALQSCIVAFSLMFHIFVKSWQVNNPSSKAHVGIGAFNLVRRVAYQQVGGHLQIAMRPDDDVKLGKILKDAGFRAQLLNGVGEIKVEWYASLRELVVGLEKNSFAVLDYEPLKVVVGVGVLWLITVWPFVALVCTSGIVWWLNAVIALIWLALDLVAARILGASITTIFAFPLANVLFGYITVRSMVLALRIGGIRWRDTFYPLALLKANRV